MTTRVYFVIALSDYCLIVTKKMFGIFFLTPLITHKNQFVSLRANGESKKLNKPQNNCHFSI